jgi:hypothetical protein
MESFEFLYEQSCQTPSSWHRLEDRILVGPEVIQEMEEQMQSIRKGITEAQDRYKSYVDAHRIEQNYECNILDHPGWATLHERMLSFSLQNIL